MIPYEELAHKITETVESRVCSEGWQAGDPVVQMKSKGSLLENILLLREVGRFSLFVPSTDWMRPTCIMKRDELFLQFTDLNISLTQNTL